MEKFLNSEILIVDDEPANIFFLENLLLNEGYKVTTASSGRECIRVLSNFIPDVILLDIMMPEMDGLDVLDNIMHDSRLKEIPVIMVTAKTESLDVEQALDKGAMEYIKKPIDEIELLARIRASLRIKKQEDHLKDLVKSKEEFIKIISQDLRTPFTSISGYAEMLYYDAALATTLDKEHKDFLKFIIDTSNNVVSYFNKLLNWTNIEAKEINLKITPSKLSRIVNASRIILQKEISEKELSVVSEIDDNFTVNIDETYFGQVVRNLLSNAVKYTSKGGKIRIFIRTQNTQTQLVISDNGVGIRNITPEEMFSKKINKSTRGTQGETGTGIGLGICKKIIDAHGFQITFKSEIAEGTDVIITL
ncbi:MAG: hybrid sensor histidine kinase/response regulator [Bacteroidales bacterium]|nr:hybrid sensor histidine kinase/response regulator [Bacteroidales bacterium]